MSQFLLNAHELRELRRLNRRYSSSNSTDGYSPATPHPAIAGGDHVHRRAPVNVVVMGNQHCTVPKFKRAGPIDIKAWMYQMENYFHFARLPQDQWVRGIIGNIHQQHFKEVKEHRHLAYPLFRAKILALFKEPDLKQAMMRELMAVKQETAESLAEFMARIQNLSDKAFRDQRDESKQQVAVSAFSNGLIDQDAARLVAVQAKGSVARALNIAASVNAYSKHPVKARKYKADKNIYNYNLLADENGYAASGNEVAYETDMRYDQEEPPHEDSDNNEEFVGAFPAFRGIRTFRGGNRGWRPRGGFGRGSAPPRLTTNSERQPINCFRCGGKGHIATHCSSPGFFKNGEINPNVTCLNCGETGHIRSQCTNLSLTRDTIPSSTSLAQPPTTFNTLSTTASTPRANPNTTKK